MMWLIARREFVVRVGSRANVVASSVLIVLIVAGALIAKPFLSSDGPAPVVQVASGETAALVPYLESAAAAQGLTVTVQTVDAPDTTTLPDGVSAILTGAPTQPDLYVDTAGDSIVPVVQAAVRSAALAAQVTDLGGDPASVAQALAAATPTVTPLSAAAGFDSAKFFSGFIVVMLLFFVLIQSASVIMLGVVEEKASRVVEILLATVKPWTLLGGKVLGVGLFALAQAGALIVALLFGALHLDLLGSLSVSVGTILVNFAVWFVLGFSLFTVLFGGLASLVSRQEDVGSVSTPLMFVMLAPLYLAIYLVPNLPDATITKVLTQIPFFAPFMVPMRMAFGSISVVEVVAAVVICLVAIPVLVWVGGRVYAGAVLNTGGRMRLADAFRRG
ncbi:ABC transporter permease [Demequina capsici]|uniref:ABC transporter permease n=1 Tax=Demequina capsici TaxID=3075620 RepID=A0AA96FBJ4_9MICO|nr:ABC transporter permease [Demequina sp. PMTSA13]WNM26827.1 ABC transporter permease [Demequina sp. PMTSA13]